MDRRSGSADEFFGDQATDSDCDNSGHTASSNEVKSSAFGTAAGHDYRSQESAIKTLSYLDGFDETKGEKLQEGFRDGYKQAYTDAFLVGQQFGSLSAKVACAESSILMQLAAGCLPPAHRLSDGGVIHNIENSKSNLQNAAALIHRFLIEQVLTGSSDEQKDGYADGYAIIRKNLG